jgi:hypothetical protein
MGEDAINQGLQVCLCNGLLRTHILKVWCRGENGKNGKKREPLLTNEKSSFMSSYHDKDRWD